MIKVKCFYIHTDEDVVSVHLEFWTKSVKDLDEAIDLLLKAKRDIMEYDRKRGIN